MHPRAAELLRAPAVVTRKLGPHDQGSEPVLVVEAGFRQTARSTGEYTLVSCTVGPGFEFADFEIPENAD